MNFISETFFIFCPILLLLYFVVPVRVRWWVLLLGSLAFYSFSGVLPIPIMLITSLIACIAARMMQNQHNSTEKEPKKVKSICRRILFIAVGLILIILIACKFQPFVLKFLQQENPELAGWTLLIPLGISYYTFSIIGYLADVYWKKDQPEKNYFKLLLYMIYFPHILQGPIPRHKKLAPQLIEGHAFDYKNFCFGLQLALWGYIKKLVIADRLAIFVNEVFGNYQEYGGLYYVVAAVLATIQLYCDFSGCMDIAAGISQILGIKLEKNFNHPFFSKSAAEFWRRWHITLGAWFKDYVYMPLVISPKLMKIAKWVKGKFGKRSSKAVVTVIPLVCVWLLTGLWHGTGWNYVVWGVYWGTIIIISTVFEPEIKKLVKFLHINAESKGYALFQMIRTFAIFAVGRLITIPGNLHVTLHMFKSIIKDFNPWIFFDGSLFKLGINIANFTVVLIFVIILWKVSRMQEKGSVREKIAGMNIVVRWVIYYAAFLAVVILGIYGSAFDAASFVYMNY